MADRATETVSRGDPRVPASGSTEKAARLLFAAMALLEGAIGTWAAVDPDSFYRSFPGGGWRWILASGPYNEHLVRDFGGLTLALAVTTLAAALFVSRRSGITALVAWEVYSIPHLSYHLSHLNQLPALQDAASAGSLVAAVVAPAVATALALRSRRGVPYQGAQPGPPLVRRVMRVYWAVTNPLIRPLAGRVPWWVLLETRGWRSGQVRRVPLATGPHDGQSMQLIAVHGQRAHWVRNIQTCSTVRVRHSWRWYEAEATVEELTPHVVSRFSAYARGGPRLIGLDPVLVRLLLNTDEPVMLKQG